MVFKITKVYVTIGLDPGARFTFLMRISTAIGGGALTFICGLCYYYYLYTNANIVNRTGENEFRQEDTLQLENMRSIGKPTISIEEIVKGPLAQNDSRILDYIIKHNFLKPPSSRPYNLTNPNIDPSMGQSKIVRHALNDMQNGFFVECGALDGETRSNTLYLERHLGWKGLLIEGDPKNFKSLLEKNRKAWSSDACLATKRYPHQVMFKQHYNTGRISSKQVVHDSEVPGFAKVQCFPFFSLVSALNVTVVDYFSLDVEGSELEVLRTIPFDSVYIKVLSVEYVHDKGGREAVKKFMTSKGYRVFGEVKDPRNWANDFIFVNNKLL